MGDQPTAEALNFDNISGPSIMEVGRTLHKEDNSSEALLNIPALSSSNSIIEETLMSSHLSLNRGRSDSNGAKINVKRAKPNSKSNDANAIRQLEESKVVVHEVINSILSTNQMKFGYEYYCQKVQAICKYKHTEQSKLADYLKTHIEDTFMNDVKPAICSLVNDESILAPTFIQQYLDIYRSWESKLRCLTNVFIYLDKNYLLPHPNKKVILELGMDLMIDNLLASNVPEGQKTIKKYTVFLQTCISEGFNNAEWKLLLQDFTKTILKLNFKKKIKLNNAIIDLCVNTFVSLKATWAAKDYMHLALTNISNVVTLFKDCGLTQTFNETLLMKCKWILIFADFDSTTRSCLPYLLEPQNGSQLSILMKLCELTLQEYSLDSIPIFVNVWGQYIYDQVCNIIEQEQKQNTGGIIGILVNKFDMYQGIVKSKLKGNDKFEFEIRHSFSKSINATKRINTFIINQLCKFSDSFFKKKLNISYQEFESKFMIIFKLLNSKIDFITNYKIQLSRRLLLNRNINISSEKKLVDSIINIVGENDDSIGLNVMFKDLSMSQELYSDLKTIGPLATEFNALILEKKHWPEIPKPELTKSLPHEFSEILDKFDKFYKEQDGKLKNHNLDWRNYNLHQLTIMGHFDSGDYELNVNLLQAIVISMFNEVESISKVDLVERTGMEPKLLTRVISSLSDKYPILIDSNESIKFNKDFIDKSKNIRLPLPREKENTTISSEKIFNRNRDVEVRGALIRTLKHDTKILYSDLVTKCLEIVSSRGPISIKDIKDNIEFLINKEYISRDADNKSLTYIP